MVLVFIIPFVVFFVIFLMVALNAFKIHRGAEKEIGDIVATISAYAVKEELEQKFPTKEEAKEVTCAYCGVKNSAESSHCSSCGASLKNKK